MKKVSLILAAAIICATIFTACSTGNSASSNATSATEQQTTLADTVQVVTEIVKQNGPVTLDGNTLVVELEENPTTGYTLAYDNSNPTALKETENNYTADTTAANQVGSGGVHIWKFTPQNQGQVVLQFGQNPPGTDIFCEYSEIKCKVTLTVDEKLQITDFKVEDLRS